MFCAYSWANIVKKRREPFILKKKFRRGKSYDGLYYLCKPLYLIIGCGIIKISCGMDLKKFTDQIFSLRWWFSWAMIFVGCTILAAGYVFFINPYNIVPGGVYGASIVLHNIFPSVQVGTFGYMFDIPLMIIAIILFGGHFGARTIIAAMYTPGAMNIMSRLAYPNEEALAQSRPVADSRRNAQPVRTSDADIHRRCGDNRSRRRSRRAPAGNYGRNGHRRHDSPKVLSYQVFQCRPYRRLDGRSVGTGGHRIRCRNWRTRCVGLDALVLFAHLDLCRVARAGIRSRRCVLRQTAFHHLRQAQRGVARIHSEKPRPQRNIHQGKRNVYTGTTRR